MSLSLGVRCATALILAAAAQACTSEAASQRARARLVRPAQLAASPAAHAPPSARVYRVRAYADDDYRARDPRWEAAIVDQLERANAVLEPEFGVRLQLEAARAWHRPFRPVDLQAALAELSDDDPGEDVDWVVGWVGLVPDDGTIRDAAGLANAFSRHFVLRATGSARDRLANASWELLTPAEREAMAADHRLHQETSTFLHEWAHTLGAVHECPGKWIMSREGSLLRSTFSPESARLVRVGLLRRGARTADEWRAWAAAYGAEAQQMAAASWECEVMEKALARKGRYLESRAAEAERPPDPERAAGARYLRRLSRALAATYQAETGETRFDRHRPPGDAVLFLDGERIVRWQFEAWTGGDALRAKLALVFERTRIPPVPEHLRDRYRTDGIRFQFFP